MSVTVKAMPTDKFGRYSDLIKELIKADSTASRSEDNKEMLIKVLDVVAESHGYNVAKKRAKKD